MDPGAPEWDRAIDWSSAAAFVAEPPLDHVVSIRYCESRLAAHQSRVDTLLAVHRSAAVLACERTAAQIARHPADAAGWRMVHRLFERWSDGRSLTSVRVPTMWLEFDDVSNEPCLSLPSVSVCITPSYSASDWHRPHDESDLALAREALTFVGAERRDEEHLARVFAELPRDARWIHVSYMLGRDPRAVKLYGVMRRRELLDYLRRIGWSGDRDAIAGALERLYPEELLGEQLFLDLNLNDFLDRDRCSLGLAVSQQHLHFGADADPSRARVLRAWTQADLCDPDKVEAVKGWPASSPRLPMRPFEQYKRFLDVKLVWTRRGFTAKAYAGQQRYRALF